MMTRKPYPRGAAWRAAGRLANQQAGFTLIELMVGMAVGLLVTLAIAGVLVNAENQRRTTTMGSDAQINGGLAIYAMERELKMAGYGLMTDKTIPGCKLVVQNAGTAVATAPPVLAPVLITAGAGGAPDSVRVLASARVQSAPTTPLLAFSMPLPVIFPFYDPSIPASSTNQATNIQVSFTMGVQAGDLLAMAYGADQDCQVFQASSVVQGSAIQRLDSGTWNANKFPSHAASQGTLLVNLGTLLDDTFALTADQRLSKTSNNLAAQTTTVQNLQSNIVGLKAFYGKDTDADDVVDTYDTATPTTNAGWLQVRAVRIAVLARSAQYEKDAVTTSVPQWDVGNAATVVGSTACGGSQCIPLMVVSGTDWQHYRYKVFDVVVPLRNQLWRADFTVAPAPPAPAPGKL